MLKLLLDVLTHADPKFPKKEKDLDEKAVPPHSIARHKNMCECMTHKVPLC
jgi:hypothetical protein